uniref:Uncharacterized protein n=1 Tax=Anguilla anguilla TaxID=7936 RepID=A0A0E9VQ36_ANGAN
MTSFSPTQETQRPWLPTWLPTTTSSI